MRLYRGSEVIFGALADAGSYGSPEGRLFREPFVVLSIGCVCSEMSSRERTGELHDC